MTPSTDATAPLLLEAMQDRYPIVRYFSANALAALRPALPKPDYLAPSSTREATLQTWSALWPEELRHAAREARERLTAQRSETDVEVGE
jgi:hypothetical protein